MRRAPRSLEPRLLARGICWVLLGLSPLAISPARAAPGLDLSLQSQDSSPDRRFEVRVDAGPEITSVVLEADGQASHLLPHRPFRLALDLGDSWRPLWVVAVGLDATGRERAWAGNYLRAPEDLSAALLRRAGDAGFVVLVRPALGLSVNGVDLVAGSTTLRSLAEPPFLFRMDGSAVESLLAAAPVSARVRLSRGAVLESWISERATGESIEVRVGHVRLQGPAEVALPAVDSVRVLWRERAQKVLQVEGGNGASLELGLMVDISASTSTFFAALRRAASKAAQNLLGAQDRLFVASFGEAPQLLASGRGEFSSMLGRLPAESRAEETALYSSLIWGLHQFHGDDARAALIVVSDGCDTNSRATLGDLLRLARERAIPIFLLRIAKRCPTPPPARGVPEGAWNNPTMKRMRLEDALQKTGGQVFVMNDETGLGEAFNAIAEVLRRQWLVVFEPESADVRSSDVQVTVPVP